MSRFLCVLMFVLAFAPGCSTRTDFVLPEGFRGPALILFDDPLGEEVRTVGWRHEEYRLGADGVLRLRTPFADRLEKETFFFADSTGKRTKISQSDGDGVQILRFVISAVPRRETPTPLPNGGSSTTTKGGFTLALFIVGRPSDYPSPTDVEFALQDRIMRQEYARLSGAGL